MNETTTPDHADYNDLLAGYALGAIDDEDRRRVAAHLDECPVCRLELEELRETAALLAFAAPRVQPPPRVKAALFARLATLDAPPPVASPPTVAPPVASAPVARPTPASRPPLSIIGRKRRVVLAALAATLVVTLGWWNVTLQQRNADLAARVEERALVARLLDDPRAAHSLSSTSTDEYPSSGPAGFIYTDPRSNVALVLTYYLPQLPPDKEYQLWLVKPDGSRDSGGLFTPDANGSAQFLVRAPAPFATYRAVGVTVEPKGGSPGPTSPRIFGGALQ